MGFRVYGVSAPTKAAQFKIKWNRPLQNEQQDLQGLLFGLGTKRFEYVQSYPDHDGNPKP